MTDTPDQASRPLQLFMRIPVIGWITKDLLFGAEENIYYFLVILLTLVVVLVMNFGLPALAMSALFMVPIYMCLLIAITRG